MKFSEKLQKMRKENKLSQEQLADQLEVSRQAVSKWESGQTYPEMDKLLALCKIFKCSLDELTNDEIVDIKGTEKGKLTASNLIEESFEVINKSIRMFKNMETTNILNCLITMALVVLGLFLLNIPVHYLYNLGENLFQSFGTSAGNILSALWNFIISVLYLIFAVIFFFYTYKVLFLEKWENIEKKVSSKDDAPIQNEKNITEHKEEVISNQIHYVPPKHGENSAILKGLSKIIGICFKIFVAIISMPFLFFFFVILMMLVISIFLLFKGVLYIGVLLLLLSSVVFGYLLIELLFNFLFNRKNSLKKNFIIFMSSIFGLGIGAGITAIDVASTKFIDEVPSGYKIQEVSKTLEMNDNLTIFNNYNQYFNYDINYKEDNTLNNIVITVSYYDKLYNVELSTNDNNQLYINESQKPSMIISVFWDSLIDDLAKKEIHNYSLIANIKVTVSGNKKNLEKIKENQSKALSEWRKNQHNEELFYLRNEINNLQEEIRKLEEEKNELQSNSEIKDQTIEEYKQHIQDYKDQLSNLLNQ